MNGRSLNLGWAVISLIALVLLNLIFLGFVAGSDVALGAAPQFTIPIFVPLLVVISGALVMLWRTLLMLASARVRPAASETDLDADERSSNGHRSPSGRHIWSSQTATLHSVLIIRRQSTPNVHGQSRVAYETTV